MKLRVEKLLALEGVQRMTILGLSELLDRTLIDQRLFNWRDQGKMYLFPVA